MIELNSKTLEAFEAEARKHVPNFQVRFKDESKLMAALGVLAAPFNPRFMADYVTTWGDTVFFPSRKHYEGNPARSFKILAHEFVHLWDARDHRSFKLSYVMPQALVVPLLAALAVALWPHSWLLAIPVVGYVVGAVAHRIAPFAFWTVLCLSIGAAGTWTVSYAGWWGLVGLVVALVPLVPWPSPWRTKWEMRGYGMNVALAQWMYGKFSERHLYNIVRQFVGPNYLFMCWSRAKVVREMVRYSEMAHEKKPLGGPYDVTHEFLNSV